MALERDTVQHTLCIPLWGRAISTRRQPGFFPDPDAARILDELGEPRPESLFYRLEYPGLQCIVRQYDMACEIEAYARTHPGACVIELGAGLSCLRRQMAAAGMTGASCPWYAVDLPNVIELRERLVPDDGVERRLAADLNDHAWMERVDADSARGTMLVAAGLFYYFRRAQVEALVAALAERFPGGALAFDATNGRGIRGVNKEVELAGNATRSYFSLEDPAREVPLWSPRISGASERDYLSGYATPGVTYRAGWLTRRIMGHMRRRHLGFIVHVDFAGPGSGTGGAR